MAPDTTGADLPEHLNNNTVRLYYALDEAMMIAHRKETDEGNEEAIATARTLVENADVPLIIRARACMVLGCSCEDDFLAWAEEGVRVARLMVELTEPEPTEMTRQRLRNCQQVLDEARAAMADDEASQDSEEEEEDTKTSTVADTAGEAPKVAAETESKKGSAVTRLRTDPTKIIDENKVLLMTPPDSRQPGVRRGVVESEGNTEEEEGAMAESSVAGTRKNEEDRESDTPEDRMEM